MRFTGLIDLTSLLIVTANISELNYFLYFSVDGTPPTVTCPADVTFDTVFGGVRRRVNWTEPTVSDNLGNFTLVSKSHNPNDFFNIGIAVVTYTYKDASNNVNSCTFTVSIVEGNTFCLNPNPNQVFSMHPAKCNRMQCS